MIIAAGLSPAWQQILVFEKLTRGAVNRAVETARLCVGQGHQRGDCPHVSEGRCADGQRRLRPAAPAS